MFTGIIEEVGTIRSAQPSRLAVAAQKVLGDMKLGDSINVNGVCLTVTALGKARFSVGLMPETLRRTNLGMLHPNDKVNLERALSIGDRLGGHFVQGHIDGTGRVLSLAKEDEATINLTSIGRPFMTGYDWKSDHTSFTVYGDPNREVSWVVYADRDDPVNNQEYRPVEIEKGPDNQLSACISPSS